MYIFHKKKIYIYIYHSTHHQGNTQCIFANIFALLGDLVRNALPNDAHRHIELQRKCEEDSNGNHKLDRLSQSMKQNKRN